MTPTHRDAEFSSFVSAHSGTLRRTAYLLTGHTQTAEDLLQDALVKTWLAWPRIDVVTAWACSRALARLRSRDEAAMATRSQS